MKRTREESNLDNDCVICASGIKNKDLVALECCHMYHSKCVINLVEKEHASVHYVVLKLCGI